VNLLVIVVGLLLVSPLALAKPPCPNDPDLKWPKCEPTGGDSTTRYYDVTIKWPNPDVVVGGGENWMTSNSGDVDYSHFDPITSTAVLNLDFFQDYFNSVLGDQKGEKCFPDNATKPDETTPTVTVPLYAAGMNDKKNNGAQARFWFEGWTHTDPPVEVLYLLSFFKGQVDKEEDWPPAESNTMTWGVPDDSSEWKMRPENQGASILANSCVRGKDAFSLDVGDDRFGPVFIKVDVAANPP
jgi:hypothetical protein